MESCSMSRVSLRCILLAIAILLTCSVGESEGFFLKNLLSETKLDELQIFTTLSPDTHSLDTNHIRVDEIHRNVSENIEESSTQIVNSVKDIVSSVLDEHITDNSTNHKVPQENNQVDAELRNISIDGDNDIPAAETIVKNVEHDPSEPQLNIVKIPEADNVDIATTLENNIRSSVKDEIQIEQIFESSAIDVIDDIPEPEVRQTLTKDLMAMEYPQSLKKSDGDLASSVKKNEDKIDSTEATVDATTNAANLVLYTTILPNEEADDTDVNGDSTTVIAEAETSSEFESTTPTIEAVQEFTLIPTVVPVHPVDDLQDASSILETKPVRTRQMRGFDEESNTLSKSDDDSSDSSKSPKDSKSKSSESATSSASSSNESTKEKGNLSAKDENVGAEETSQETNEVISQDASVEGGFQKEAIPSSNVIPTPRPQIAFTTEESLKETIAEQIFDNSTDTFVIEAITESNGEVLNEVSATTGDGYHTVIRKPGVEAEPTLPNTDTYEVLGKAETPVEDATNKNQGNLDMQIAANDISSLNTLPEAAETLQAADVSTTLKNYPLEDTDTPKDSQNPEYPIIPSEGQTANETDHVQNTLETFTEPRSYNNQLSKAAEGESLPINHQNELSPTEPTEALDEPVKAVEEPLAGEEDPGDHNSSSTTVTPHVEQVQLSLENDQLNSSAQQTPHGTNESVHITDEPSSAVEHKSNQILSTEPEIEGHFKTPIEPQTKSFSEEPNFPRDEENDVVNRHSLTNEISKHLDETSPSQTTEIAPIKNDAEEQDHTDLISYETSTEKPMARSNEDLTTPAVVQTLIEAAELTTEFARHVDSFRATRDETSAVSDEIVSSAAAGRTFNEIVAEGLGKPLPTRSVGDEPSSSSYSSEDKTTTVVVLCSAAAVIFIAFSVAMYLITFQRQHGTLDIEMQEQRCGKDDLEDDEDAETRVTLLHQLPPAESDEHSFD